MNDPCGSLTWEYDGTSTDALISQKAVLKEGKMYTIAPMIADAQDHIYDSGIIFGPNKPRLEKLEDFHPDFSEIDKKSLQKLNWNSFNSEDLSQDQTEAINWDHVNLNGQQGKQAFSYENADWTAVTQFNGFGENSALLYGQI